MDYLTVAQAAKQLDVTKRWIQKLVAQKKRGPFPGAQIVKAPKPYAIIPISEVSAYKKRRGQSAQD